MITLLTGVPGSGKTAAMVEMMQEWSAKGRRIYSDGVEGLAMPHDVLDVSKWHEPGMVEDGALIVVDEVQRRWRPVGAGSRVTPDVAELETHRHRGLDFLLTTQHPGMVHANVRKLVGRWIHIRDVGLLGRWWYEWPEAGDPARFKDAPVKKRYSLPKHVFTAYKSASVHVKPVRSIPRVVVLAGVGAVVLGGLAWYAMQRIDARVAGAKALPAPLATASAPSSEAHAERALQAAPAGAALAVGPTVGNREPYEGVKLTLAGHYVEPGGARRTWLALWLDGVRLGVVPLRELLAAGYAWRELAPCVGVLIFGELERLVRCDATVYPPPEVRGVAGVEPSILKAGE